MATIIFMPIERIIRRALSATVAVVVSMCAKAALACPTCKDTLTDNYVQAYGMSIIFMMSMPFIIFGLLSAYFYYEVCKARREKAEQSRDRWSREAPEGSAVPNA